MFGFDLMAARKVELSLKFEVKAGFNLGSFEMFPCPSASSHFFCVVYKTP